MAGYDASVQFNSENAERKVNAFARSIGNLRTNFKTASTAGKTFGSGLSSATEGAARASSRIKTLDRDLTKLSNSSRKARSDLIAFGQAVDSASISRAAASIDKMSRAFANLATSSRRTQSSMSGIVKSIGEFRERAGTAATAAGRLATALGRVAVAATRASRAVSGLSRSLGSAGQAGASSASSVGAAAGATGRMSAAASSAATSTQRAANGMRGLSKASRDANESLLESASVLVRFRNVASFLAAGFGVQALVEAADNYKLIAARLNIVATSAANLDSLQKRLLVSSNATRTGYKENAALFTKLAMAGEQYGVSQEQSLTVTENVAKALKISGASASESAAATQQLSQAFASGKIQGDELRSVLENSPRLAQALSTELADLGINLSNVRDKAAEGKIGINELVRAFGSASITKQLAAEFELIPVTIGDALTLARNKFIEFVGELDKATGVSNGVVNAIVFLADNLATLGVIIGFVAISQISKLVAGFVTTRIAAISLSVTAAGATTQLGILGVTARTVGASLLAVFGGPLGLAITGVALAIGVVVNEMYDLSEASANAESKLGDAEARFRLYSQAAVDSGVAVNTTGQASDIAGVKFDILGGAISRTIGKFQSLAANARFAAIAVAQANIAEARSAINKSQSRQTIGQVTPVGRILSSLDIIGGQSDQNNINKQRALILQEQANIDLLGRLPDAAKVFNPPSASISAPSGGKKSGSKKGGGGGGGGSPKDTTDQITSSFDSLTGQLDDTEAARQKFESGMETLDAALKKGIITTERYKEVAGLLAKDTFKGLADQIKDVAKENKVLQEELSGGDAFTTKFKEGADLIKEQVAQIDEVVKKEGDKNGVLAAQRAELLSQVDAYAGIINKNKELVTLTEKRKKEEEDITRLVDESSNKLFDLLTNRLRDSLSSSKNIFKSFFKDVFGFAKDLFSQVLGAYVFEPIRESFRKTIGSAFGSKGGKAGSTDGAPAVGQGLISQVKLEIGDVIGKAQNDNSKPKSTAASPEPNTGGDSDIVVKAEPKGFIPNFIRGYKGTIREVGKEIGSVLKPIGKALKPALEKLGVSTDKIGKAAGKAFAGAQLGGAVADLGKLVGIKTSKVGGQIGGAIGSALPIPGGEIIGSVIGSIVGGMFKKAKFGTTVITGATDAAIKTSGNSKAEQKASSQSGGVISKGLRSVADQLGGTVGSFKISIGSVNGETRVSNTGRSGKLKKGFSDVTNFGKDGEAEAIAFAIQEAVKQGAIKGIREGSQRLLQTSKDLEDGLRDAIDFENVFRSVEQRANPVKFAMKSLGKEFERLTELFVKAGASSEEFATLGEFFRQETDLVLKSATEGLRKFRDDLIGGDASFKSPTARLSIANTKFADLEGKIASGQNVDQDEFTGAGQALQQLARQVYGSTPEFQAYQQRLLDATNKLITNAEAEATTLKPVIDAINSNGTKSVDATNETNVLLKSIMDRGGFSYGGEESRGGGSSTVDFQQFNTRQF